MTTNAQSLPLTHREKIIVQKLAMSASYKDIAASFNLTYTHIVDLVSIINSKTGCRGIADLTRLAIKHGLIRHLGDNQWEEVTLGADPIPS